MRRHVDVAEGLILAERKFAVRGKLEHADEPGRLVFQVFPLSKSQENREEETLKMFPLPRRSEKIGSLMKIPVMAIL